MPNMSADQFRAQHGPKAPPPTAVLGCKVRGTFQPTAKPPRGSRKPGPPPEKEIQRQIVKALRLIGCEVDETSQRRPSGVSLGLADLLVNKPGWGPFWLALEVKRHEKSPRTPEQARREASGQITVVWTAQMAIDAVLAFDRRMG